MVVCRRWLLLVKIVTKNELYFLEQLFSDYFKYDSMIALRKAELMCRTEIDENIGGGRSSNISKPVETQLIREEKDVYLQNLYRYKKGVDFVMANCSEDELRVLKCRFFENSGLNDWQTVAMICGYSIAKIYRVRYSLLERFGNYVGVVNTNVETM